MADFSIDDDQLAGQSLELAELRNLNFGLTDVCRRRKVLGNGLAIHFLSELKMGAVSRVLGFGAMAIGTTTAPESAGDGTRLKVAKFGNVLEQGGSVVDQSL